MLILAAVTWGCEASTPESAAPGPDASDLERWAYARCEREAACGFEQVSCEQTQRLLQCGAPVDLKLEGLSACLVAMQTPECEKRYEEPCNVVRSAIRRALGQPVFEAGGACVPAGLACPLDHFCDALPGSCGTCMPQRRPGEACDAGRLLECGSEMFCGPAGTCEALRAPGQTCGGSGECDEGACVDGLCRAFVERAAGEACTAPLDVCTSGSCFNGVCGAPVQACEVPRGEACLLSSECAAGLVCRNRSCQKPLLGSPCVSNDDCGAEGYCNGDSGVCDPRKADGKACSTLGGSDRSCASGFCTQMGACGTFSDLCQ